MIVGVGKFTTFVWYTRVEYKVYTLVDQPLYMSVRQLCRITLGFARNRFNTKFINLMCRSRREYHMISQLCEESKPERIVLIHVQNSRNTNRSAFCFGWS